MKKSYLAGLLIATTISAISCKKKSSEDVQLSEPLLVVGTSIQDTIIGEAGPETIKGTMVSGKNYHIYADVTINQTDTLYLQPGVHVYIHGDGKSPETSPTFKVNGTLVSDGKKGSENWFTVFETPTVPKSNPDIFQDPATDPAFAGYWGGFQCGPNTNLVALRWTHVEYTGGPWGADATDYGQAQGDPKFTLYMNNTSGTFGKLIIEDCWIYGSKDDCIRPANCYLSIMRNTFEKVGQTGGEGVNIKNAAFGDVAYNLSIGAAANGLKIAGTSTDGTLVNIYNNTVVNCGYRQTKPGRNGSINTETNSGGFIFNNIIVNCKSGLRVTFKSTKGNLSDTANTRYNNNLTCIGRGTKMIFIEPNQITRKQSHDLCSYTNGDWNTTVGGYDGTNILNDSLKYDPLFYNYNVQANSSGTEYLNNFRKPGADFRLLPGSPAINAGVYIGGTGIHAIPAYTPGYGGAKTFPMTVLLVGGTYGANVTPPNKDLGAFPTDGTGNQHF